jgi:fermentation-respiration switch protein FrsA (DUF1100 family)
VRAALITAAIVLIILFLYAQMVRRSSMFFPAKFPEGNWTATATDIQFKSSDGVQLHGWLFRSGEPLLIFFHGNAGNITERAPIASELARRGISVLLFDWRGYGKSEGTPSESGLFLDALAAYDFAHAQTADIVLYGESLGGPYAAYVATKRKARCVIIENSFPSLAAIGNALYSPVPLGWFAPFSLMTARWLNQAGVPVLIMHGKRDQVIPFQVGMKLYEQLHVPKELLVSETAGHCEIASAEPQRYYDTVVRFIRSTSPSSK